ncbi:probable disease resistance protein At4g27220 [Citrus clementina]|uniref:probable disease resistance protein At4g27220 n=1 Tax=Citrus clementina TaxID=85681 RepID=UPI000CED0063|nr:probable disease resistance protein At4g27220 [Citrus x clementina]
MEPGAVIEIINFLGPPICKYWNYHRNLKIFLDTLRSKKEDLNCRKEDVELRLSAECHSGKAPKKEVEKWLKKAEKVSNEAQSLEDKASKCRYVSRACLGKLIDEKIKELIEVYDQGSFPTSLVIDPPSNVGQLIPTQELVGEATVKEKVWGHLMGGTVCKIGVCGMGGIGKTTIMKHVHNELLKETKFDTVIWVTVSQEFDVEKIQRSIASALNKPLPAEDKTKRTAELSEMLKERKRYVLILDDAWKRFFLDDVGIPEPTVDNGCKLVLTTRSKEVARSMGCEVIPVDLLSEDEALRLFSKHVGDYLLRIPTIEPILKQVVEQCAGLPLAIVTVASSMKSEDDVDLWKNALNELKENSTSVEGMADEVIPRLKFSYDRLMDPKIKRCFLCCALYPEDFDIPKEELIEYWIVEGLIDEMETRQATHYKGLAILHKLENNCLLESAAEGKCVKMHDLVRDMALHITAVSPRYLVKAGKIRPLLLEEEWKDDVEKVSLMRCRMTEIPSNFPFSNCRTLSTLLLQDNDISEIPESFFEHMIGLKILDLSENNYLLRLPDSISGLINLTALMVHGCSLLRHVPSLAKLSALKKLDLGRTGIDVVPRGLEMLAHLTYLDLNSYGLQQIPDGMLSNLSRIQHLRLEAIAFENVEDILRLTKLEIFRVRFDNLQDYQWYLSLQSRRRFSKYYFTVGKNYYSYTPGEWDKFVSLVEECMICWCKQMEFVFCLSCYGILETLEVLSLLGLVDLKAIFQIAEDEVNASSLRTQTPSPPNIVFRLKSLFMYRCDKIRKLFSPELLPSLQNLEEITVNNCGGLEEIIAASDDDEEGENNEAAGNNSIKSLALPKLRVLFLNLLPNLMSICSCRSTLVCNSLETITVLRCPEIKRLPVLLPHLLNGQPLNPRSLEIDIGKDRWDALEWDDPNTKSLLAPFCRYW